METVDEGRAFRGVNQAEEVARVVDTIYGQP